MDPFEFENPMVKKYGVKCLVGNWFETRFAEETDKKAIAPALYGKSSCPEGPSVYVADFKQPVPKCSKQGCDDFMAWKNIGLGNTLRQTSSNINLHHGDQFLNNMTTTYDYSYRIKPQVARNLQARPCECKKKPYDEPIKDRQLESMGNATEFGLIKQKRWEILDDLRTPVDLTTNKKYFDRKYGKVVRGKAKKSAANIFNGDAEDDEVETRPECMQKP